MTAARSDRDILALSGEAAAMAVCKGRLTPQKIEAAQFRHIEEREPAVKAWARLADPAQNMDRHHISGPLSGVSVGVKDIFDTADMVTAYGSPAFADRRPETDAWIVDRLRRAGATILGKTHTTEFACFHPAPTRNPLHPDVTPGGSSSGSAAAVADGMVPISLGSQTAGSTIRPAAFCGVFGFKPTFGLIPLTGVMRLALSLDTLGLFARHLGDIPLTLSAITGRSWTCRSFEEPPCRFVIYRGPHWNKASTETTALFDRLTEILPQHAPCRSVGEIIGDRRLTPAQEVVMAREVHENFKPVLETKPDQVSDPFRHLCRFGASVSESEYRKAHLCRNEGYLAFRETLKAGEVVITPAAPGVAPNRADGTGDPVFNRMWTLLGVPCLSVPIKRPDRLPLAIQILGQRGEDEAVLQAGDWLSRTLPGILETAIPPIGPQF
ncbi:MAG: amidase [Alphaproteobacteria bacterium]|nr:amidase [Alphaproteobacteria bacterium]MBO6863229.1 amidase [Alphaproteobacteria bacterium]MEC9265644.1 amidase [Pseudomonadota bacterium]